LKSQEGPSFMELEPQF